MKFLLKILNSMVVAACQRFQFFRHKSCFLKSNRDVSKFLNGVSHFRISIIKSISKINSWKNNFMLTTRATFNISECQIKGILLVKKKIYFTYKLLFASASVLLPSLWTLNQYNLLNEIFYKISLIIIFFFALFFLNINYFPV